MARAKSTARAEARRRHRASQVNELTEGVATPNVMSGTAGGSAATATSRTAAAPPPRRGFFNIKMPNVRADLPLLPNELRTNRWIWFSAALLLAGLAAAFLWGQVGADLKPAVSIFISLTIIQQPAIPVLIGGFFARRASYLVGGVLGLLNGVIFAIAINQLAGSAGATAGAGLDPFTTVLYATGMGALFGGIAGWYRRFLNENNARARAARETRNADQRRKAKQDARGGARSAR